VSRQAKEVEAISANEAIKIPKGTEYSAIEGLSAELRRKLEVVEPIDMAAAQKIEGMTPAALIVLSAYLRQQNLKVAN